MFLTAMEREKTAARQEGWQEGRQEGRQEEAKRIAQAMLAQGFAPEQIADLTGLSLSQIDSLGDQSVAVQSDEDID